MRWECKRLSGTAELVHSCSASAFMLIVQGAVCKLEGSSLGAAVGAPTQRDIPVSTFPHGWREYNGPASLPHQATNHAHVHKYDCATPVVTKGSRLSLGLVNNFALILRTFALIWTKFDLRTLAAWRNVHLCPELGEILTLPVRCIWRTFCPKVEHRLEE